MKYILTLLLLLLTLFLLPGGEKQEHPARVTLLYSAVPGKLFSRIRPPADIRLSIRKAGSRELSLLKKGLFHSPGAVLFLLPHGALPTPLAEGALLTPFALQGKILALHPSNPLKDLPLKKAQDILKGKIGYWEKLPGAHGRKGRTALYGEREVLPSMPAGNGPLLIPAGSSLRAGQLLMQDLNGIGIFPLTFREEKAVPLLSIGGICPTPANLTSGKYPLTEKLFLYAPPRKGKEKKILERLKKLLMSRPFHIELLYMGLLPLPPAEKP